MDSDVKIFVLDALGWLVQQEDLIGAFFDQTGFAPADLAERVEDEGLHLAVLEFILSDDSYVISFCDSQGLAYTRVNEIRTILIGGTEPHWT